VSAVPVFWGVGLAVLLGVVGGVSITFADKMIKTATAQQMVTLYMLLEGIRIVIFATVIFIYMLAIKIETKKFVLVAAVIYCIYLLINTLLLLKTEKKAKNRHCGVVRQTPEHKGKQ
jgi:hypothetical protein